MSSAELNSAGQTPYQAVQQAQKTLDRLLVMPAMVGIDHMHSALADARGRVKDDHQRQKAILAQVSGTDGATTDPATTAAGGDDMGSFSIGDTINHINIVQPSDAQAKPATDGANPAAPVTVPTDTPPKKPDVVVTEPTPKPPVVVTNGSGGTSTSNTTTSTTDTTFRERVRDGIGKYVIPTLVGGGLVAGTMLFDHLTHKPDSVTTITNPGSGKFEYRYGIETHDRPKQ